MKIIFFGTPDFAAQILKKIVDNSWEVLAVVTRPDRPKGRSGQALPTPVKLVAEEQLAKAPVYQPEKVSDPAFAEILKSHQADLFVVVAYGEIVKQNILDIPTKGCINIHASLLPEYRGAAPIQRAIINGEKKTGVTIMHMVRKMDAGDMIATAKVSIPFEMTYGELEAELCQVGGELLLEVLSQMETGEWTRTPQDHTQATMAPKIELENCELDWTASATTLHNLVRGVNPEPGAWCFVLFKGERKRMKVFKTQVERGLFAPLGSVIPRGKGELIVACGTEALNLLEVQLEGKKRMSTTELLRGVTIEQLSFIHP